jgi:hypothetical protein
MTSASAMKRIDVPVLHHLYQDSPLPYIAEALGKLPRQAMAETPWPDAKEKPEAWFSIGYNKGCIFLRYDVKEQSVQARYRETNDPVYKDSCVELFIAFNGEEAYYNLEFNCLGTCLAGFGLNQHNRKLLAKHTIARIRRHATLQAVNSAPQHINWQLTMAIPAEVFSEHHFTDFAGEKAKVNFYKCGDELPEPHYLAWSSIQHPHPNFHLPEFFGEMRFQ